MKGKGDLVELCVSVPAFITFEAPVPDWLHAVYGSVPPSSSAVSRTLRIDYVKDHIDPDQTGDYAVVVSLIVYRLLVDRGDYVALKTRARSHRQTSQP